MIADNDQERIAWHVRQAHARALQAWAEDPRGKAWVPEELIDVKMTDEGPGLLEQGQVVIGVRVLAFLLDAELDPERYTPTKIDGVELKAGHTYKIEMRKLGPGGDAL